jgi:hypothetical protein
MMKCIWVSRFKPRLFPVTMPDDQHDDRTRSCICPTRGMVEAGERSSEDKRTKEDGKIKDDKEELKESKKDEKEEDKKENVKEIEDGEGAVWIKTPRTSRWSKTPTELAREANRMPSTARNVPASERKESRFAKRWAEDERMEKRREERRRQLIQEWDLEFSQLGLEVDEVGVFNRASYELHGLGLVSPL